MEGRNVEKDEFCVKVEGPGMAFELRLSDEEAKRLVVLSVQGGLRLEGWGPASGARPQIATVDSLTMREFVAQSGARRSVDKIVAVGVYLKDYLGQDRFARKDLLLSFREMAEPVPKNLSRDVAWALRLGWIARESGVTRGAYFVTNSGYELVERKYPRELLAETSLAATGGR